jgi:hypothetical protein
MTYVPRHHTNSARRTGPAGLPDTALAHAYLRALQRVAAKNNCQALQVMLPTGAAPVGEILIVLKNLQLAGASGRKG